MMLAIITEAQESLSFSMFAGRASLDRAAYVPTNLALPIAQFFSGMMAGDHIAMGGVCATKGWRCAWELLRFDPEGPRLVRSSVVSAAAWIYIRHLHRIQH